MKKIEEAVEEAEQAFWQVIADKFPEIRTGDLCFSIVLPLNKLNVEAVTEWYYGNLWTEIEEYGCFATVIDGTIYTTTQDYVVDLLSDAVEVTAPEQKFLDKINELYKTEFKLEQFSGR